MNTDSDSFSDPRLISNQRDRVMQVVSVGPSDRRLYWTRPWFMVRRNRRRLVVLGAVSLAEIDTMRNALADEVRPLNESVQIEKWAQTRLLDLLHRGVVDAEWRSSAL